MNPDLAAKYEALREGFAKGLESFDRYFEALEIKEAFALALTGARGCCCGTKGLADLPGIRYKQVAPASPGVLRKYVADFEATKQADGGRLITYVASHETIDRDSEVVLIEGIEFDAPLPMPLLAFHDPYFVAGATHRFWRDTHKGAPALWGQARMLPATTSDRVAELHAGLDLGALSVSIGFRPLKQGPPRLPGQRGPTHTTSLLLENSLVPVPACPECRVIES